ncbi:MAG: tetratricopeptide repeat protein, partial [Burkholderiaceae bacterium]
SAPAAPAPLAAAARSEQAAPAPAPVKDIQPLTPQQQAENAYRRGLRALQRGDAGDAQAALEQALAADPHHAAARQTLAGLLLDEKRPQAAVDLLQAGLRLDPAQTGMAMILARIQVEQGATGAALDTLQRSLPDATERADYQAFLAALLQRQQRHAEAIEHYRLALRQAPANGVWWMGLGISLRDAGRTTEARDAFTQAAAGNALSPQLRAFVEQQLQQLPAQP